MIAPNLLYREFVTPAPNCKRAAELTHVWTQEGAAQLATDAMLTAR